MLPKISGSQAVTLEALKATNWTVKMKHGTNLRQYRKVEGKWQFVPVIQKGGMPDPRFVHIGDNVACSKSGGISKSTIEIQEGSVGEGRPAIRESCAGFDLCVRSSTSLSSIVLTRSRYSLPEERLPVMTVNRPIRRDALTRSGI